MVRFLIWFNMVGIVFLLLFGCGGMVIDVVVMLKNMIRLGKSRFDDNLMRSYFVMKM